MKVKLIVSRAGVGFSQTAGEEIVVDDDEGKRMIEDGQAVPVVYNAKRTATKKPREKRG